MKSSPGNTTSARRSMFRRHGLTLFIAASLLALAGCATPSNGTRSGGSYGTSYGNGYHSDRRSCSNCGTVQSVQQVYVDTRNDPHVLGTIIGAVVGGALGNQVGKGDGRKAATVAGAVAGGVAGHAIAKHNSQGSDVGYRIRVRLNDGRMATVTQRDNPRVRSGDYVIISNDHVYLR